MVGFFSLSGITSLVSSVFTFLLILVALVIFVGVAAGLAFLIGSMRTYKYTVVKLDRRINRKGEKVLFWLGIEKGGIVKNKKLKRRMFKLKKSRVYMSPQIEKPGGSSDVTSQDIPSIPNIKGGEVVFVEQLMDGKFVFLDPIDVDGQIKCRVTNEDVTEAVREYDSNIKHFSNPTKALLISIGIFAVIAFMVIILLWLQSKQLGESIKNLQPVMESVKQVTENLVRIRSAAVPSAAPG